jgi:hypothetical protein
MALSLALGTLLSASGQSWQGGASLPFFRLTPAQTLAATKRGQSSRCLANLRQLGLAATLYANDYRDRLPQRWSDLANSYLADPRFLYCPADPQHPRQTNWAKVDFSAVSYALVATQAVAWRPEVFARCAVHRHALGTDGRATDARPYELRLPWFSAQDAVAFPRPAAAARTESVIAGKCRENLNRLSMAIRLYAIDNQDRLPASLAELADLLLAPEPLFCPAEPEKAVPASFTDLDYSTVSYLLESPGQPDAPVKRIANCQVHGHYADSTGAVFAGTNLYPPRLIRGHPLSRTVEPGASATLAVLPGDWSAAPFRFQWRRVRPLDEAGEPFTNTVVLADATNQNLVIRSTRPEDEGYYDVVVTDASGLTQFSQIAFLRVEPLTNLTSALAWREAACAANLTQFPLASGLDAVAFGVPTTAPTSLSVFLGWPLAFYCPSDPTRHAPASWESVDFGDLSYVFNRDLAPHATTNTLATCRYHGFQVQADGTLLLSARPPLVPHLEARLSSAAQDLILVVRGIPGQACVLEASPDLNTWNAVSTNWLGDGWIALTNAVNYARTSAYFRVAAR